MRTMTTCLTGNTGTTSNLIQANNAIQVHIRQVGASLHNMHVERTVP